MFTMPTSKRFLTLLFAFLIPAAALTGCSPTTDALNYFPPAARSKARCIILRESGGNPDAVSPTGDYGLFQINAAAHAANFQRRYGVSFYGNIRKVSYNARYARYLYDYYAARGLSPFTPWNGGRYPC